MPNHDDGPTVPPSDGDDAARSDGARADEAAAAAAADDDDVDGASSRVADAPERHRPPADHSREIERAVERLPGDEVRCTRVGEDTYRCNWWRAERSSSYDNPSMKGGQLATDHRIRRSAFLRVTKGRKGLRITDLSRPSLPRL